MIGVLPAALLSLVLSIYFTQTIISDIEDNLEKTGISLASNLAKSSVFGMFTMNLEQLAALVDIAVENPKVLAAKILDREGRVIVQASNNRHQTQIERSRSQDFQVAIRSGELGRGEDVADLLMQGDQTDPDFLGSVALTLSTEEEIAHGINVKLNSFYITLFSLFVIAVIAGRLSRAISTPLLQITDDVQRIAGGDYTLATPITAKNELGSLSEGIHSMTKQLESHHKDLELKIQLATSQLEQQNADLLVARREAEEASELKSQFLSHMSHEIRTPMNGIMGFLELLNTTPLNNTQKLYLDTVQNSSRNLLRIINEVLDLSRLEAGRSEIIKSNFDLNNTILECLDLLDLQAHQRFVDLQLKLEDDLPQHVYQDPVRLNQVLINLLSNAIKFSYQSTVTLSIRRADHNPEHTLLFSIHDEGAGIDEKDLTHLFDPFTQFNSNKMQQGSGLGLAISKQIIDSMGGDIGVFSTLHVGSTFWFTFPFDLAQAPQETDQTMLLDRLEIEGKRFLVADDNDINLHLLTLMLEKRGAIVDQAVDGVKAVEKSKEEPYDMLMFDIIMPNQSGTEALQQIRTDSSNPNASTPAIAITALPTQELQQELVAISIQNCLTKPVTQQDLGKVLQPFFVKKTLPEEHESSSSDDTADDMLEEDDAIQDFEFWRALQQMNNNRSLIRTLLLKLFDELPDQMKDIERLVIQKDFDQAHPIVHKVHGSAAYCCMPRVKSAAKVLEIALKQDIEDDIELAYTELKQSVDALLQRSVDVYVHDADMSENT